MLPAAGRPRLAGERPTPAAEPFWLRILEPPGPLRNVSRKPCGRLPCASEAADRVDHDASPGGRGLVELLAHGIELAQILRGLFAGEPVDDPVASRTQGLTSARRTILVVDDGVACVPAQEVVDLELGYAGRPVGAHA